MLYYNLLSLTLFIYQTFGCREKPNEVSTFQGCWQAVAEYSRKSRKHSGPHARRTGPGHALYCLAAWSSKLLTSSDFRSSSENWVKESLDLFCSFQLCLFFKPKWKDTLIMFKLHFSITLKCLNLQSLWPLVPN